MSKLDKGKVRMTVIHFETESDNDTLKENIRAIAHTLTKALSPPPRIIQTEGQGNSGNGHLIEAQENENLDQHEFEPEGPSSLPTSGKKRGSTRQYTTPEAIDLDLTSGEVPLKTFMDLKKPENVIKKYLAIAYWLKRYREITEVGMNHAYTCFRHMGWTDIPKDAAAPFRAMKSNRYGWMKSTSRGQFSINHLGENEINKIGND